MQLLYLCIHPHLFLAFWKSADKNIFFPTFFYVMNVFELCTLKVCYIITENVCTCARVKEAAVNISLCKYSPFMLVNTTPDFF